MALILFKVVLKLLTPSVRKYNTQFSNIFICAENFETFPYPIYYYQTYVNLKRYLN